MVSLPSIVKMALRTLAPYESLLRQVRKIESQALSSPLLRQVQEIQERIEPLSSILRQAQEIQDLCERWQRENRVLAEMYRDPVRKYLAERGWYVGPSLGGSQIAKLAEAIRQGNLESEIEDAIAEHVRCELDTIEQAVLLQWSDRSSLLRDGFSAHREGKFSLSVPLFLAQADGMAYDILKAHVFTDHSGKIKEKAQQFIDEELKDNALVSSFVGILVENPGMRIPTDERDKQRNQGTLSCPLNRHGVMHGIDIDYPTENNSLRAVSLISLLTDVYEWKNEEHDVDDDAEIEGTQSHDP
jgi:hypothetical protein